MHGPNHFSCQISKRNFLFRRPFKYFVVHVCNVADIGPSASKPEITHNRIKRDHDSVRDQDGSDHRQSFHRHRYQFDQPLMDENHAFFPLKYRRFATLTHYSCGETGIVPPCVMRRKPVILFGTLGNITLELFETDAPKTSANFKQYVEEGFYDGTVFHRNMDGFMIQAGLSPG